MKALAANSDSLLRCLIRVSTTDRTGKVEIVKDGEAVGSVVICKGKVAWAVCRDQPETLGTFLWRLGRITRKQFDDISRLYAEQKGEKKLGVLLEQAGYIKRPVLRRCLLLHTRKALGCLITEKDVTLKCKKLKMELDDDELFDIDEVLPHLKYQPSNKTQDNQDIRNNRESREGRKDETGKSPRGPLSDKNHPLRELSEIPGYLASAIISAEGEVVVADTPDGQVDPCLLGVLLVTVLEASSRVVVPTSLGSINFLLMDCDEGTLLARWIDDERKSLAAILLSSDGNLGLAKYKVNEALPALSSWLERHSRELTK